MAQPESKAKQWNKLKGANDLLELWKQDPRWLGDRTGGPKLVKFSEDMFADFKAKFPDLAAQDEQGWKKVSYGLKYN